MRGILIVLLIVACTVVYAQQDAYVELLRADLKAEKVAVITEAMNFSEEESLAFWPIYREY